MLITQLTEQNQRLTSQLKEVGGEGGGRRKDVGVVRGEGGKGGKRRGGCWAGGREGGGMRKG